MDAGTVILIFILIGGCFAVYNIKSKKEKAFNHLIEHISAAKNEFENALAAKTRPAREKRFQQALGYMQYASQLPNAREQFSNFDSLFQEMQSTYKVDPICTQIQKALKYEYKEQATQELNCYKEIMYLINENGVTNADFAKSRLQVTTSDGKPVKVETIREKCRELGWNPPS